MKIEHAAAYLPYGLKLKGDGRVTYILRGIDEKRLLLKTEEGFYMDYNSGKKPILRPLSDLTKEITENRETFVPLHAVLAMCMKGGKHERDFLYSVSTGLTFIESIPMWAMQKLLSWHFDIFGLIESGEAIDVNTLEKNPYE